MVHNYIVCAWSDYSIVLSTVANVEMSRLKPSIMRYGKPVAIILALIAAAALYYTIDPATSAFAPQCMLHRFTGLQCPGCGSQRMLHAMLHGNVAEAFRFNPFLFILFPFIVFALWLETQHTVRPRLYAKVYCPTTLYVVIAAIIIWFVVRNIYNI